MFCKNCGNPLDNNERFCPNCGGRLDDVLAPRHEIPVAVRPSEGLPERSPGSAPGRKEIFQRDSSVIKQNVPKKQSFLRSRLGAIILSILTVAFGNLLWGMINSNSTPSQATEIQQSAQVQPQIQKAAKTTQQRTSQQNAGARVATNNYDIKARPAEQDFSWVADAFKNGAPQGAQFIREFDDIRGTWKCMIIYDPDRQKGAYARDLSNVTISGYEKTVNLVIDWYQYLPEGQAPSDMTKDADTTLRGEFFRNPSGKGTLEVNGNPYPYFTSSNFYVYQGKQYMVGNIMCKNGVAGFIAMVRP